MRLSTLLTTTGLIASVIAGPAAYGICQAGCAAVVVACTYLGIRAVPLPLMHRMCLIPCWHIHETTTDTETWAGYAGAGAVFGTVTAGAGVPPALLACNAGFGTCQAACALVLLAPTP